MSSIGCSGFGISFSGFSPCLVPNLLSIVSHHELQDHLDEFSVLLVFVHVFVLLHSMSGRQAALSERHYSSTIYSGDNADLSRSLYGCLRRTVSHRGHRLSFIVTDWSIAFAGL